MRSANGPSKLFVGDIGNNRKSDLNRLFSKYGEVSTIYIDDIKRFAFVEFTSSNDAQRALRHTNNKTVNGSRLRVEYAKSDKASRDNRRPASRERSPVSLLYNHLQVTANRLPSIQSIRESYYQYHPSTIVTSSSISRGRSLTPPSFKHNGRLSSMNHLRTQEFYPPYYPPHSAIYPDPAYYRTYGDPYLMQRMPPPAFLPPLSSSPPPIPASSLSYAYRNVHVSSDLHRYPPDLSNKRTRRSRSGRRNSKSRKTSSSRGKKSKRRSSSSSSSSSEEQRERGPQTPPLSQKTKKKSRSRSDDATSASEQKLASSSSSEGETSDGKQFNFKKFQNVDSSRKHSKRKTRV